MVGRDDGGSPDVRACGREVADAAAAPGWRRCCTGASSTNADVATY